MTDDIFNGIQIIGFDDEGESYKRIIKVVITAAMDVMSKKAIPYDFESLNERITTLKLVRREGSFHEYEKGTNTLYLSKCNMHGKQYCDEEMIIFFTHELMHFISTADDSVYSKYCGYDEFFTEYMTFIIICKIGGINLECFYKNNTNGYFGDGKDISIMKSLSSKIGFEKLLALYTGGTVTELETVVGKDILLSINNYFDYYDKLIDSLEKPIREVNKLLELPSFIIHKRLLERNENEIIQNIANYKVPKIV